MWNHLKEYFIEVNNNLIINSYYYSIEMNGGIGKIEMFKKTNILALIGGGENPRFSPKKIIIWDDHQANIIGVLVFNKEVLNVRMRNDKIFGVLDDKIYIFNLNTLETIKTLETFNNPTGIIAISSGEFNKLIIAYPFEYQGFVNFRDCFDSKTIGNSKIIKAHESKIACLAINKNGTLLATSSDIGTLIRLFNLNNGENISVFRRGTKSVSMICITFSPNNIFFGCISDVGTVHIFTIFDINKKLNEKNTSEQENNEIKNGNKNEKGTEPKNRKSILSKIGGFFNITDHDRNFAKFKIQDEYGLLSFGNENTFVLITKEGKYIKAAYDPKNGGNCQNIEEKNFLNEES